jgi:predicted ATP-grasp superfamily ATP-dependent carboligase
MFARRRVRMYPPDFGNSSSMISIPLAEAAEAVQTLERLLRDLRYRGIFSAEFKLDPRDGLFKLLEVNCRPWWFNGFAADCGVDTTLMAYRDALGLPVERVLSYREGVRMAYSFNDLRAVIRTRTPLPQALKFWFGARDALFARDDPRPFFRYAREQTIRIVRGALRAG